ncbi:MAG: hypothetical protein SOY64_10155 [Pyramidobacter sp.]|uniref:hypothetical protein n=1 Tax=unclassified Pyramidobacter TaxID=2632171 RepID=UPI000EA0BFBF|nr:MULTISPECIES: hypothetical protein [unclassified Pyramidobacter]MDY4033402.1 hypothetical protein [Pyramidobacter sp.]RKJ80833.1 hypothetical protein D7D26_02250 [Pyramidobacter sp. CG50-2]
MRKTRLVLGGLAIAILGSAAAWAVPPRPGREIHGGPGLPPPLRMQRWEEDKRISEKAPEEIKNAFAEMKSLKKDLRLELGKDKPDSGKALEMLRKSEELHAKVREWQVKQILEGNAPKPAGRRHRGGFGGYGPDGRLAPAAPGFGPHAVPHYYMMPMMPYSVAPMYHCPCMTMVPPVPRQDAPAAPAAEAPAAK